jgi:hypothetical protein
MAGAAAQGVHPGGVAVFVVAFAGLAVVQVDVVARVIAT